MSDGARTRAGDRDRGEEERGEQYRGRWVKSKVQEKEKKIKKEGTKEQPAHCYFGGLVKRK